MSVPLNAIYENVRELTKELMKNFNSNSVKWFDNTLQNVPNDVLTSKQKQKFTILLKNFNEEKVDSMLLHFVRRNLSRKYRKRV